MRAFGKYRLIEPIASGGMADVYRAELPGAEGFVKEVALKLIRGDHGENSDFVRMFIQEAQLASRLAHANVVQVFEFDRVDARYYIAMELVRGRTLRNVVDRCREAGVRFGVPRAVHVGAEVAKALAHAHRASADGQSPGLVHRDVSPQNVLVSFEGEVKLTDFGIARAMGASGLTTPGTLKGKLSYMAPEQARGEPVDGRADVFSLAVVIWELCAGRRLFSRDSDAATLAALLSSEPISPPSAWNDEVRPELDRVVLAALERDPARRTASAQELATGLGTILLGLLRSPGDADLRELMHRLWPEGASGPLRPGEPTAVRPPSAAVDGEPLPAADPDVATGTASAASADLAARRAPARPRRTLIFAAALLVPIVAGSIWLQRRTAPGIADANATPAAPTPNGATAPTRTATETSLPAVTLPVTPPATPTPTATATPTAPTTPTPNPNPTSTPPRALHVVRETNVLRSLPLPPAASGDGILSLDAEPWANVVIDGHSIGDTPREVRLAAGSYRVRLHHPSLGARERTLVVRPGKRQSWIATLK